ncbi:hypothetical protein AS576_13540 [Staphylococcus aureus]|uniref:Uncharacterized protein n=1 Tax=Staphylococcus aureus TaxID=1280 RepID=A0AAP7YSE1_STAAU|nr:hypothetical protein M401_12690 [Staphylococcus aureus S94]OCQ28457.1 hypothetical protein A6758_13465 [Staphylococcus aureus]OCQ32639.1 hypothetical protein A6762_13830 [Staphylococcus aureus]OCQ37082.1 hypothetical protein A6760_13550 [Staphylococcus aureus]OWT00676.1 hypothetical protein AS566_13800 [Staphylococcus aureus]
MCLLAPVGNIAFNQHGYPLFMPIFKFACRWAVLNNNTGSANEISIKRNSTKTRLLIPYRI